MTLEQLKQINKNRNLDKCEYYYNALNTVLQKHGINTPIRIAHFLAQIIHESGYLLYDKENLNYSAAALRSTWPRIFITDAIANVYARQPEKIANKAYASRMGNGNEASGDGWKYRGRGLIQLTGTENYRNCGQALGMDLINQPDLIIENPETSVAVACWFWNSRNLSDWADKDDVKEVTRRVNGGFNGLDDRMSILAVAKNVLI